VQAYITAVWVYYRQIQEKWERRGRKVGTGKEGKRGEQKRGERKCKKAKVK